MALAGYANMMMIMNARRAALVATRLMLFYSVVWSLRVGAQRGGFYVECGALDGERSSNTLYLERERGWTGLLVEMDPYFYTQLIGKSRRSWSINACLSPQPYVTQVAGVKLLSLIHI